MEKRKRGRPTDSPKPYQLSVKYDEECKDILDAYCAKKQVTRMEAVRRGLKKLGEELS